MAFGFLGYLAKKLFGGDDEDRGSSSSSSSYSEPVRYEEPQRVYAAEQKQTYSPPQQRISYQESKPSYSYVEDSPRTTTSGGNRQSYSSLDEDIFGDCAARLNRRQAVARSTR